MMNLDVRLNHRCTSAEKKGNLWTVTVSTHGETVVFTANRLVIASGECHTPMMPSWTNMDAFKGEILHSSAYKTGENYKDKRVLVVGTGNSGSEIALDLWEWGAKPFLLSRSPAQFVARDRPLFNVDSGTFALAVGSVLTPRIATDMVSKSWYVHLDKWGNQDLERRCCHFDARTPSCPRRKTLA
eukprot:GABV01002803.1.p1 GENE.GABV01002803.1~~GABV01002803.1.p1  ORF type:complete len:192 (+),score=40.14 GABV01002803.1:24-578(+)